MKKMSNNQTALMFSFIADLQNSKDQFTSDNIDVDQTTRIESQPDFEFEAKEFTFIIDRSGSMHGKPINVAKEALKLFIRSLPGGSYFNVYSFGSDFAKLYEKPQIYTQENLNQALE